MQFIYSPLTWSFFAVLAPLLIHLINLLRHQRVKWAAMEFLLKSYKKHRTWVWLKQFLLLLMRMGIVAAIVAMCAKLVTHDKWSRIFGGKATHHYILLDDSCSMSQREKGVAAFDRALDAIGKIVELAAQEGTTQKITLIRFSQALGVLPDGPPSVAEDATAKSAPGGTSDAPAATAGINHPVEQTADLLAETITPELVETFERKRGEWEVTELAVDPSPAFRVVQQLLPAAGEESPVVYVISDFRAAQWDNPSEYQQLLRPLQSKEVEVQLVRCVKEAAPNLALVDVAAVDATRTAGVPFLVEIKVHNYGTSDAVNVPVKIRTTFFDPEKSVPSALTPGRTDEVATLRFDKIAARETASRQVEVMFPRPGQQVVEALLPDDGLAADNRRQAVIEVLEGMPVLVVDGDPQSRNWFFLNAVFQFRPGERANTGVRPQLKTASYIRDASTADLATYRAVYLLDVPRLDERAVLNLEGYVRGGGGLAFFAGPNVSQSAYNEGLYKNGQGLFPLPLERTDALPPADQSKAADLQLTSHPLFRGLTQKSNLARDSVDFAGYWKTPADWKPAADSGVAVLARLRNHAPLVVERRFGTGRVVAVLSTASPEWNNWAKGPVLPMLLLNFQSYLSLAGHVDPDYHVGEPISISLDPAKYLETVGFFQPARESAAPTRIDRSAEAAHADKTAGPDHPPSELVATLGGMVSGSRRAGETDRSGLYQAVAQQKTGNSTIGRYALNVDASEGDLALTDFSTLRERLEPIKTVTHQAEDFTLAIRESNDSPWSQRLLWVILGGLLVEQILAYVASYHALPRGGK